MSYHVFFSFSTSLARTMKVPAGTHARILQHIQDTEEVLGLKRKLTYTPEGEAQRPGWHWRSPAEDMLAMLGPEVDRNAPQWWLADRARDQHQEQMASAVREHNAFVRGLYKDLGEWSKKKPKGETEEITVAQSEEFWGGLATLELPRELWTEDHFTAHMEHLFELLTKGESEGVNLDCKPFSIKQADALIRLFEDELDQWGFDLRFSVPLDEHLKPYDRIAKSSDGGYDWCSRCGPINSDDFHARCAICPHAKKGRCDLKNSHPAEFED